MCASHSARCWIVIASVLAALAGPAGGQTTPRASVSSAGQEGNDFSHLPAISAGGLHPGSPDDLKESHHGA